MKISKTSINRPVTITMIVLIVVLLGFVSLSRLNLDLYPNIEIPVSLVSTNYTGVGPQEVESLVTKPLEGVLSTVSGIDRITSISGEGTSFVVLEFDFGTDMDNAALEIREKVDMVKDFLPEDASEPTVFKLDPNAMPIINYSISSDGSLDETQQIVEDKILSRIERIAGVASVSLTGGFSNEVTVTLDETKLKTYNLTASQIANLIRSENINLPGGQIAKGTKKLTIRSIGEFQSVQEIENMPITLATGATINLKDVATVKLQPEEQAAYNRINGKDSISLSISKQSHYNTVNVANEILEEVEQIKEDIPEVEIITVFDQSEFIRSAVSNVAKSGMIGGLLAIMILYLFLRNVRTTLIIAISIPVSVIATFFLMFSGGVTLNLMTLGGLSLGMGMLVDNSIVVLENIYRFRVIGYSRKEAADKGSSEVAMAVVASTLTTVAVFLPIIYVEGVTSMIFRELAMTVTFSLLGSLMVALTLVPMLASKLLRVGKNDGEKTRFRGFESLFERITEIYKRLLAMALRHKVVTVIIAVVIFASSIGMATTLGAEFIPAMDEGRIDISVELPVGKVLDETTAITEEVLLKIEDIPEIENIFVSVGSSQSFVSTGSNTNISSLQLDLVPATERERSTDQIADAIRKELLIPGAVISISATQSQGFGGGGTSPISISIKGDDLEILKELSNRVTEKVKAVEGTREVTNSYEEGSDELQIMIKRDVASQYGLNAYTIANTVQEAVEGITASTYKKDGQELDIVVKQDAYITENLNNLKNLQISTPTGISVPLEYVAELYFDKGPLNINRVDQVRSITVGSSVYGRDLQSVSRDIKAELDAMVFPVGYTYEIGGETQEIIESFSSLGLAMILAVLLVYMVMASQFESLLNPFIIMFSVPLSLSGGIFALRLLSLPLSVPGIIGVIMLVGIVVNNGIVLVDYINHLRRDEHLTIEEAIIKAGPVRLRPILMTTLTTVLGLLPLAIGLGEGTETSQPLAAVVIGGLLLSTLLTLVFIPVLYTLFNRHQEKEKIGDAHA